MATTPTAAHSAPSPAPAGRSVSANSPNGLAPPAADPAPSSPWRAVLAALNKLPIIHPDSHVYRFQRYFVLSATIAQLIVVPMEVAFRASIFESPYDTVFDACLIIIYSLDLLLHFHVAYHDDLGKLVTDRAMVRRHYLRGRFAIDLVGFFPFEYILQALVDPVTADQIRLLHIIQAYRWYDIVQEREMSVESSKKGTMLLVFLAVFMIFHWLGCIWWMVQITIRESTIWANTMAHENLMAEQYNRAPYARYVYLFAFVMNAVTMPGYGIFKSSNVYEIVLSLIYNGLGAMIIGIYLALVVSVLTNKLEAKTHVEQHVRSIINFMHDHGLPEESQQRVLEYYQAIWKLHKGKRVKGHFDDLPQCLRTEIAFKTCGEILRKIPLFNGADDGFLRMVAVRMEEVVFVPGEFIIRRGDHGNEMYCINRGHAQVVSDDLSRVWADLIDGAFFGELALFTNRPRTANIISISECHVFVLTRTALLQVLKSYPDMERSISHIVADRVRDFTQKNTLMRMNPNLSQPSMFRADASGMSLARLPTPSQFPPAYGTMRSIWNQANANESGSIPPPPHMSAFGLPFNAQAQFLEVPVMGMGGARVVPVAAPMPTRGADADDDDDDESDGTTSSTSSTSSLVGGQAPAVVAHSAYTAAAMTSMGTVSVRTGADLGHEVTHRIAATRAVDDTPVVQSDEDLGDTYSSCVSMERRENA
ncbi:hypothetical protein AMAG_13663 [Allomyces macrogynus ATCC 38327]|uniref:Cyclic nucleotide-binding domain-containing protein n=2 Tax=Allomyces macrogynus (strain ATCC 38327) TaxID=578462 RepID=A0A0L0T3H4_ALLM3|nr:hypothetical protein AMAG_13663 [Allomyces macrogynus ATCC 38327]|eukprot:KNE69282.1 hypothetical protein AMAG_13663 [Allomyces macrogynus ATCC 38327]